jgi:DNA-binding IclR family transcriptional regulator
MVTSRTSDTPAPTASRGGPQSVGRLLCILERLAAHRAGATLAELASAVGAPKTSLVGLLAGLVAEDAVHRDETGRYRIGTRVLALAVRALSGQDLLTLARPVMTALAARTGETVAIGALAPDQEMAVYLAKVDSPNPVRYAVSVGERRELYCTAVGKALLAHFDTDRLARYLDDHPRRSYTPATLTRAPQLLRELERIRRTGVAFACDERFPGASGVAAPIVSPNGRVVAALLVAAPSERMRANAEAIEGALRDAARDCSRLVGAQG